MRNLVVFYSRKGVALRIAKDYHMYKNADLLEIKVKKNYLGPFGYFKSRKDSISGILPEIEPYEIDFKLYDNVVILGSVWSKKICSPLLTFLHQSQSKIKNVEYIAIGKRKGVDFNSIFNEMDYILNVHHKRATALVVRFNRIESVQRF
ncbi:MAG: hypothetical protein SO253_03325 [Bacilli bacterium]|nr:hypothetical protein [Bacilli bacterium]